MRFRAKIVGKVTGLMAAVFSIAIGVRLAPAQTTAPATQENTSHFQAKDFSDMKCFAYANAKASFAKDADQTVLKAEFGKGDGMYGGFWFPISSPKVQQQDCRGFGMTVRGNGTAPEHAYLFLRTSKGVSYRSKNINTIFQNKEWQDLLLTAGDFTIDPAYARENPDAAKALPAQPDWKTFDRLYFAVADGLAAEPTVEFKSMYFVVNGQAAPAVAPTTRASGLSVPITPVAKSHQFPEGTWLQRHEGFVQRAKQGDVDLLWLGDSITDRWNNFKGTYGKYYANYKAANFGIGGDQTQNLLWRLENGELEGIQPKVAVLLIGTNNVQWHPSDRISAAIAKIIQTIQAKSPKTKVLLLGIFPRGDLPVSSPAYQRIKEVNASIAKLDDGKMVRYLDISSKLTNADGSVSEEVLGDKVHPTAKGYAIWAEAMQPLLDEMMK